MMPEIGNGLLCLALRLALLLSVYPLWGVAARRRCAHDGVFRLFAAGCCWLFVCIGWRDFWYWSMPSWSTALPSPMLPATPIPSFRCGIAWRLHQGAHEGSLLLWVLLMSGWTFAVAITISGIPLDIVARVLAIMGMVSVGFLLFILFTSNPFSRTLPNFPIEGRDLNPLLQDLGRADLPSASALYGVRRFLGGVCFRHCFFVEWAVWTLYGRVLLVRGRWQRACF
ncbi:cytochrome c biogenesis protein CcsA [Klebsiella pneumoniae]|nr:cytochrome c biogenesis protein CcsA [Klebsiella pneumoniae]